MPSIRITALIQPLDQGLIAITKKLYKKHLLRSLLIEEKAGNSFEFLKSLDFKNCFGLLSKAWGEVKESTLRKGWKPILGEEIIRNFTENSMTNERFYPEHFDELQYQNEIRNISCEFSNIITAGPISSYTEIREALHQWFEKDADDCGWQASSDEDIVNFVTHGKITAEEVSDIEEEEIVDESSEKESVSSTEAYESLSKFKSWLQNLPQHLQYHLHSIDLLQDFVRQNSKFTVP